MPNKIEHLTDSAIISSCFGIFSSVSEQTKQRELGLRQDYNASEIVLKTINTGIYGGIGGLIIDLLEPATSPSHRKFFHSLTFLGLLCYLTYHLISDDDMNDIVKLILSSLSVGSIIHILEDSQTPKSIPFI